MKLLNYPPPQVHHEITSYHNFRGNEVEEVEEDENRGGVCCKGKGWRVGGYHKGGKKQGDKERGDGKFSCYDGEGEVPNMSRFL